MKKLTCVIVEDDPISAAMAQSLAEKTGLLDVLNTFSSPAAAIPWLMETEVDLLFLDVEMPGMTGFEMIRSLWYAPEIIVISGNPGYAAEAFDLSVTDYLVKPLKDFPRFLAAVNKVARKKTAPPVPGVKDENLFVKVDSLLMKLDIESILYVEAYGDYIKIQTTEKTNTVYSTLKKLEDKLDPQKFVRVHRSFIVNITKITNVDQSNLEINKKIIPISGTYKDNLVAKLNIL